MKKVKWIAGLALGTALLIWPEASVNGARQAAAQWYASVAPSLFPFLALLPLITCREAAQTYERLLGRWMQAALRLPGAAAPAFAVGMVAGSPAGAMAARRIAAQNGMNQGQLLRLAVAACGLSPAFLITGIGATLLGSASAGFALLRAQIAVQLILALILRGAWKDRTDPVPPLPDVAMEQPVRAAVTAVLSVCG